MLRWVNKPSIEGKVFRDHTQPHYIAKWSISSILHLLTSLPQNLTLMEKHPSSTLAWNFKLLWSRWGIFHCTVQLNSKLVRRIGTFEPFMFCTPWFNRCSSSESETNFMAIDIKSCCSTEHGLISPSNMHSLTFSVMMIVVHLVKVRVHRIKVQHWWKI